MRFVSLDCIEPREGIRRWTVRELACIVPAPPAGLSRRPAMEKAWGFKGLLAGRKQAQEHHAIALSHLPHQSLEGGIDNSLNDSPINPNSSFPPAKSTAQGLSAVTCAGWFRGISLMSPPSRGSRSMLRLRSLGLS